MFDPNEIERARKQRAEWEARELAELLKRQPETRPERRTGSGLPVNRVYGPDDLAGASATASARARRGSRATSTCRR